VLRITTKGRYALRAMLDLACHSGDRPVTREDIAVRQKLPATYLAQLFASLTKAGLVDSVRGPGGGYVLGRASTEITAGEIIRAVEGPVVPVVCVADPRRCERASQCSLRQLYSGLGQAIEIYLDGVSLDELCNGGLSGARLLERHISRIAQVSADLAQDHLAAE
jgi:Rrf2 family protein